MAKKKVDAKDGTDHSMLLAAGGSERRVFTQPLPVPLTPEEKDKACNELVELLGQRDAAEEAKKGAAAMHKEILDRLDGNIKDTTEMLRKGTRDDQVQCVEVLTKQNEIRVCRTDTGAEIEVRTVDESELQEALDLDADEKFDA
jgi:hypothetical protein